MLDLNLDLTLDFELFDYEEEEDQEFKDKYLSWDDDITNDGATGRDSGPPKSPEKPKSFRDFLLKQELLRAISDAGFESPSTVQNECIPQAIMGCDILCQAKSGMGKTCVFVLSTLQQLDTSIDKVLVLVLTHTRELAFQISREYERFSKYLRANTAVFFGGVPPKMDEQVLAINKPQIVVGTTGRMIALIRDKKIDLRCVRHFIIDECDKMLGHKEHLDDIISINRNLPRDKQVMMFSATMNEQMRVCAKRFMETPLEVIIGDDTKLTLHGLQQFYVDVKEKEKLRQCYHLLTTIDYNQTIIFVSTINRCNALEDVLVKLKQDVIKIHGGMQQGERLFNYNAFKACKKRVLVVTKMFDRGIDFERVNLVINYDFPEDSDTYLHAVGRAGRFGTKGVAVSFVDCPADDDTRRQVQKRFDITLELMPEKIVI